MYHYSTSLEQVLASAFQAYHQLALLYLYLDYAVKLFRSKFSNVCCISVFITWTLSNIPVLQAFSSFSL